MTAEAPSEGKGPARRAAFRHLAYECAEAPAPMRFIAYTLLHVGRGKEHRLAVAFPASTKDAALAAAARHWQDEVERQAAKEAAAIERGKRHEERSARKGRASRG